MYGVRGVAALIEMIGEVLHGMGDEAPAISMPGHDAAARLKADGHLGRWQREASGFDGERDAMLRELLSAQSAGDAAV